MPERNVVDSSGWIEYFADGPNAEFFEAAIADAPSFVVPSISIYEVFKRLLADPGGEEAALQVVAAMRRGRMVELALDAAKISWEMKLPMAHSIIFVTAHAHEATLCPHSAGSRRRRSVFETPPVGSVLELAGLVDTQVRLIKLAGKMPDGVQFY